MTSLHLIESRLLGNSAYLVPSIQKATFLLLVGLRWIDTAVKTLVDVPCCAITCVTSSGQFQFVGTRHQRCID